MEWRDTGIVLNRRPHGENAIILDVFTRAHGRHAGVVRGGAGRKLAPLLQPGNQLDLVWRARLAEHIGAFTAEPVSLRSARLMDDPLRLSALTSLCALCSFALPEREPLPAFQAQTEDVADRLISGEGWLSAYLFWELDLLEITGFRLDLTACARSGATSDLAYVSPKTGRAVSRFAAGNWAPRLLPLPACLLGGVPTAEEAEQALALTGYFLENWLAPSLGTRPLPSARTRFVSQVSKAIAL